MRVWLGREQCCHVHRLVAAAFLGPAPPGKPFVCHRDDDPSNNRVDNLYWGDSQDNADDRIRNGRSNAGERSACRKLSREQVLEILKLAANSHPQKAIAARFGCSMPNVQAIVYGISWNSVTGLPKRYPRRNGRVRPIIDGARIDASRYVSRLRPPAPTS